MEIRNLPFEALSPFLASEILLIFSFAIRIIKKTGMGFSLFMSLITFEVLVSAS